MRTKCHCIFCPKHPLHDTRGDRHVVPHLYSPDRDISNSTVEASVNCLIPESEAFNELSIDAESEEFPVCAYGDGGSVTGFEVKGAVVKATCAAERYSP